MANDAPSSRFSTINPPVFFSSLAVIVAMAAYAVIAPEQSGAFFSRVRDSVINDAGWFYMLSVGLILGTVVYIGVSRYGDIKLGPDHAEPDYTYASWFAMLFSAGMGIGLMFFGVAEPVMHYLAPPAGAPETVDAARAAMKATFFHWGLHAWSIYAIVGLILGYFSFRHGLPLTLRSALYPIIGERIHGPIGHAVDVFAIVGTVFGVATSLGYGVFQVNAGLAYLFGLPETTTVQVILIAVITGFATISVVTGLDAGIRRLSELNLALAVLLMLFVLLLGPTIFLMQTYVQNTGAYLSDIVNMTFNLYAYEPNDWIGGWTLLYWGWWLSWSPFVGMFIARVSRGRTLREFAFGVMLVPALFTLLWMTVFGNTGINMIASGEFPELGAAVLDNQALALFKFLEHFPLSEVLSLVATVMVVVFFVTSSDSGSMVVDMLASGGRNDTPVWQRIFWASSEGLVAIALLLAGGLGALQAATIASALPFVIVLLVAMYGLLASLRVEGMRQQSHARATHTGALGVSRGSPGWKSRLLRSMSFPRRIEVVKFLHDTVRPAMESVAAELREHGLNVELMNLIDEEGRMRMEVSHNGQHDFAYGVRARPLTRPSIGFRNLEYAREHASEETYYRAEVFLAAGGQGYDLMGYNRDQVIADITEQYEKHMHFLHMVS